MQKDQRLLPLVFNSWGKDNWVHTFRCFLPVAIGNAWTRKTTTWHSMPLADFTQEDSSLMGFISRLSETSSTKKLDHTASLSKWRDFFAQNEKETNVPRGTSSRPIRGGSYARSMIAQPEAYKRLLQAMRSMAPGGWSDDRWEQGVKHWTSIVYTSGHRICEQMAQSHVEVLIKDHTVPGGRRVVTPDDPPQGDRLVKPYDLQKLLECPNDEDSWGDYTYMLCQQMILTGMALTWMVPNQLGVPMELYSIPTAIAIPQPAINPDYPDGYYRIQPIYPYGPFSSYPTPSTAVGAPIPAQWMLRMKLPHPLLRYDGYSPLTGLRQHVDEVEMMDKSRHYSMRRTIQPSAILNFDEMENTEPLPEAEIDRIRAEFENTLQGPENVGQLFVATPGAKLEPWGMSPKEMEYYQSWEQLVSFVMAGLGITRPVAGMIEDSSYATLFAALKQFQLMTMEPLGNRISERLTRQLACFYGDNLIVKIKNRKIDDHDVTNAKLGVAIQAKAITKNQVRHELGYEPVDDPWGKDIAGDPSPKESEQAQQQLEHEAELTGTELDHESKLTGAKLGHEAKEGDKERAAKQKIADNRSDMFRSEPGEVGRARPKPGSLGQGSLGPRKSMDVQTKSFYDRVREAIRSGSVSHQKAKSLYELASEAIANGDS